MKIRVGQAPAKLARDEFSRRFRAHFQDPLYDRAQAELGTLEDIAWTAYEQSHKAPRTRAAGAGYADPTYELSVEWLATKAKLEAAESQQRDATSPPRVLVVCASARNDGSCPGELSKTFRLAQTIRQVLVDEAKTEVDFLDLSLLTSEYGRQIHPCKACVSTAMPLCHWPCSCYPNHSLGQVNDWMAELYERFTLAHGVIFVTLVYWHQAPSVLKLLIDRLVCADGGNPDPTSTQGKKAELAKQLEGAGWSYPQHLAGRAFGVVAHGDVTGASEVRRALSDWARETGLVDAGEKAQLDRYIGYFEPYSKSHDALDRDLAMQEECANIGRAVAEAVRRLRAGQSAPDARLETPRPK